MIDTMEDGVMLYDKQMRWAIDDAHVREFQQLPESVAHVGAHARDIVRFQAEKRRGEYGTPDNIDEMVEHQAERALAVGRHHLHALVEVRPLHRVPLPAAARGGGDLPRPHRHEAQGGRGARGPHRGDRGAPPLSPQ